MSTTFLTLKGVGVSPVVTVSVTDNLFDLGNVMAGDVREETFKVSDFQRVLFIFIHSFIHSGYFYSASSSPLLLQILCRSLTPKHHRQLRVKNLPRVPTWRLERDSNP